MIFNRTIGLLISATLFLSSCNEDKLSKNRSDFDYIEIKGDLEGTKQIEDFIKPYHNSTEVELDRVLSYSKRDLLTSRGTGLLESPLGNLLSDLVLEQANERYATIDNKKADFVVLNRGGIRTPISKGSITQRNMFEIMPFENTLLVVTITPEKMQELLEYMANSKGHPMSNIRLQIKDKEAINVEIGGKTYDKTRNYKVITTDYLQHGGDRMYFLSDPIAIDTLSYKMRDAMIDYFEKTDTVDVKLDGRFSYAK
ncbi:MAG: 5'-nucleotidase C-terminal domain-containing protein [Flavobacteriales bacterium]|nr:5'-nucleotidase C-terminal domain-containing protein [Flavobacteriales bacterium]